MYSGPSDPWSCIIPIPMLLATDESLSICSSTNTPTDVALPFAMAAIALASSKVTRRL